MFIFDMESWKQKTILKCAKNSNLWHVEKCCCCLTFKQNGQQKKFRIKLIYSQTFVNETQCIQNHFDILSSLIIFMKNNNCRFSRYIGVMEYIILNKNSTKL